MYCSVIFWFGILIDHLYIDKRNEYIYIYIGGVDHDHVRMRKGKKRFTSSSIL
jgi:hypothetical protein